MSLGPHGWEVGEPGFELEPSGSRGRCKLSPRSAGRKLGVSPFIPVSPFSMVFFTAKPPLEMCFFLGANLGPGAGVGLVAVLAGCKRRYLWALHWAAAM